jgi:hypothetical protein
VNPANRSATSISVNVKTTAMVQSAAMDDIRTLQMKSTGLARYRFFASLVP